MSRWGKPTKNSKRRDPRYFLNESVEGEETLNEFELGFDLDDESDEELMRDQEWVERDKKKMMPAVKAIIAFLESDEPQALGIQGSTLSKYKKYFSPLVRLLNADQEYLVKLYRAARDEREGRTPMAEQSRNVEDSIVVKQAKEKGFPLAAAAAIGLATLDTTDGPTLLKNANKYIYKGKLGQLIQGAQGIYATLDQVVRNFRGTREKQFKEKPQDAAAGREATGMSQGGGSQGYRLEEIIKEELKSVLDETGKRLPPSFVAAGLKPDPDCDRKVPDGAKMREYKKCLENPAAYQPPKSGRRTLDDIPDIGVSRTGGPRPDHPFYSKK